MPELPEVEVIKLGLQKRIIGLKIQEIQVFSPKSFQNEIGEPFDYAQGLRGKKVLRIWRRAKILGVDLTAEDRRLTTLLFHLKMSGQLIYEDEKRFVGGHPTEDMSGKMPNSHTRVIFSFASGSHLYFNDQRKFGWIRVVDSKQLTVDSSLKNLGPEPLEKEFNWQILKSNLLNHKSQAVKVAIMDQSVVAGVGNIYANEACFMAKIDPKTKVKDLNDKQFQALSEGIVKSLKEGIRRGGSTRVHFVDSEGQRGYFLDYAFVYWRDKHPCKVCGTQIKKTTLGGRGTYFCPSCQTHV